MAQQSKPTLWFANGVPPDEKPQRALKNNDLCGCGGWFLCLLFGPFASPAGIARIIWAIPMRFDGCRQYSKRGRFEVTQASGYEKPAFSQRQHRLDTATMPGPR
jgi:hypothetical protein